MAAVQLTTCWGASPLFEPSIEWKLDENETGQHDFAEADWGAARARAPGNNFRPLPHPLVVVRRTWSDSDAEGREVEEENNLMRGIRVFSYLNFISLK